MARVKRRVPKRLLPLFQGTPDHRRLLYTSENFGQLSMSEKIAQTRSRDRTVETEYEKCCDKWGLRYNNFGLQIWPFGAQRLLFQEHYDSDVAPDRRM